VGLVRRLGRKKIKETHDHRRELPPSERDHVELLQYEAERVQESRKRRGDVELLRLLANVTLKRDGIISQGNQTKGLGWNRTYEDRESSGDGLPKLGLRRGDDSLGFEQVAGEGGRHFVVECRPDRMRRSRRHCSSDERVVGGRKRKRSWGETGDGGG